MQLNKNIWAYIDLIGKNKLYELVRSRWGPNKKGK